MTLTVITISNAPRSLRGDLTKWMQEISTGVYVANLNRKVRDQLWERVTQTVGNGQATITFKINNELGYDFKMFNCDTEKIYLDGIPLVVYPSPKDTIVNKKVEKGFSNASKFRQAKKFARKVQRVNPPYVVIDIETTGLNPLTAEIIEIAALKSDNNEVSRLECLIDIKNEIPEKIIELTGITNELTKNQGIALEDALDNLIEFVSDFPIVGFNIRYDLAVINQNLKSLEKSTISNKALDLIKFVKKEKKYLTSYSLDTVLSAYEISSEKRHRAMIDAELIYELSKKVTKFLEQLDAEYDNNRNL